KEVVLEIVFIPRDRLPHEDRYKAIATGQDFDHPLVPAIPLDDLCIPLIVLGEPSHPTWHTPSHPLVPAIPLDDLCIPLIALGEPLQKRAGSTYPASDAPSHSH